LIHLNTISNVTLCHHSLIGLSLGLAILTKGTALVYVLPLIIYYGFSIINKLKIKAWKPLLIVLALALIVNLNHFRRNYQLYGSPIGVEKTEGGEEYFNQVFSPAMLISNIVRNIAVHWGLPNSDYIENLESQLQHFHQWLGIKIDHPSTTYNEGEFNIPFSNNEDTAGNPLHFLLIMVSIILFLISGQLRAGKLLSIHCAILISQFLLFCIAFKWNIWITRLHIPLFILWCPFIIKSFSWMVSERKLRASCFTLMVMALPWVLYNYSRPLIVALDWQKYRNEGIKTFDYENIWNKRRLD
jgi:4-amino-4-deoxy-L-arabinose transferase-like glycosyltransferase